MELKVWCEGIQRIICGLTLETTSQDVVFALAHATGKVGRFTLIERWRNNERLLAPHENPLKILLKWGEYANDVQFILQRSDQLKKDEKQSPQSSTNSKKTSPKDKNGNMTDFSPTFLDRTKELRKSFNSLDNKQTENIGIVKGVPQQKSIVAVVPQQSHLESYQSNFLQCSPQKQQKNLSNLSMSDELMASPTKLNPSPIKNEINLAEVRNSLEISQTPPLSQNRNELSQKSNENLLDLLNFSNSNKFTTGQEPAISANGALAPPPYRDPPPPRNSPLQKLDSFASNNSSSSNNTSVNSSNLNTSLSNNKKFQDFKDNMQNYFNLKAFDINENQFQAAQYKDLIQLIKFQREKINLQQADITKYDAEIIYLENKEKDQAQELEAISREITKIDQIFRQGSEQLQTLQYVEEENELVKQQEKTLKSEITLLRSKLANCETELLQCKNKMRILMDEIQIEQRFLLTNRQKDNRQNVERNFLTEMERIQCEIEQAIQNAETSTKTTDTLKKEIQMIEIAIAEKKRQVELLVNEMKEVNLQSLAVSSSDEIRNLLEGSNRPGSTRRIIGSPRQLENAVPTSKNPHGVWV